MEDYSITMRIYTRLGKEHIYHVDYYRTYEDILQVYSDKEEEIFYTIASGEPCCVSLLCNDKLEYFECRLDRCSIINNDIVFTSKFNKISRS